jgi:hypothetical protein
VALPKGKTLDATAARLAKQTLERAPAWLAQVGALGDGSAHPSRAA